jgi:hypothetical protein
MEEKNKLKDAAKRRGEFEREEMQKLNEYNPFGRGGAGAPLRDNNGNIVTTRKTITGNNMYQENTGVNQYSYRPYADNQRPMQQQVNNNDFMNNDNGNSNVFSQPLQSQPQINYNFNNNQQNYNTPNLSDNRINNFSLINPNQNPLNVMKMQYNNLDPYTAQAFNNGSNNRPSSYTKADRTYANSGLRQEEHPKFIQQNQKFQDQQKIERPATDYPIQSDNPKVKQALYQNELMKQIEEKNKTKQFERQRNIDMDRLEEEKHHEYL